MKKIKNKKKVLIAIAVVAVMLLAYYIYYKNSDTYKEFEESSQLAELIPYEEERQENNKSNSKNAEEAETEKTGKENGDEDESVSKGKEEASSNSNIGTEKDSNKDGNNDKGGEMMLVHITGEVKNWGVIELPAGSRVIDAVNKAGGFTDSADVQKVNLAYELSDGVKVYIPSKNEDEIGEATTLEYITADSGNNVITGGNDMKKETKSELVNINKATQTELETLPGIGPSTALKIISYRNEKGSFSSIEDIKNVSGIGESKYESIRELICV